MNEFCRCGLDLRYARAIIRLFTVPFEIGTSSMELGQLLRGSMGTKKKSGLKKTTQHLSIYASVRDPFYLNADDSTHIAKL